MTDEIHRQNAWHKPTFYAALVLLAGAAIIGAVVALSAMTGVDWQPLSRTPNASRERSIEVQPYALPPRPEKGPEWPTSPARSQSYHGTGLTSPASALRGPRGAAAAIEPPPTVMASGELVAAVADRRKIFLPNPRGDCDLVGASGAMTRAIDDCFAGKAGR